MKSIYLLVCMVALQHYELQSFVVAKPTSNKALSAQAALDLKQVRDFNARFVAWKKSLNKQQAEFMADFFAMYDELYRDYSARPGAKREHELMMQAVSNARMIMDQWNSFYRDYVAEQVFFKSVQAWKKGLTQKQKAQAQKALSRYTALYNRYESMPTDVRFLSDLQKEHQVMKALMNK